MKKSALNSAWGAERYYLDVAEDENFETMILKEVNVGNVTSWPVSDVGSEKAYYRLRAFNSYALTDFSNVIEVTMTEGIGDYQNSSIYQLKVEPNPVHGQAAFSFYLNSPGKVNIEVLNSLGQPVIYIPGMPKKVGEQKVYFDSKILEPVMYFAKFNIERKSCVVKFIVHWFFKVDPCCGDQPFIPSLQFEGHLVSCKCRLPG